MDFSFINQDQKKKEIEVGKKYLLCRKFLTPLQLDEFDQRGWELVAFAFNGNKFGYYLKKKK